MDILKETILGKKKMQRLNVAAAKKTFTKRAGTTDKGKDYENLMVASLILRLLQDNDVKDFNVWSNDQNYGEFDDVIVEIERKDSSKQKYALQLKHISKETKQLSIESLQVEKGNFSVNKYFQSFIKSKRTLSNYQLILLTTLDANVSEDQKIKLRSDDNNEDIYAQIIKSVMVPTLNTKENVQTCYKFELIKSQTNSTFSRILDDYDCFFHSFFLYTNQMNVDELKADINRKLKETFSCTDVIAENFLNFVTEWSLKDGTKEKLHLEMIQRLIALYLATPYILPISFCEVNENEKFLRNAIDRFDISVFNKESGKKVAKLWGDARNGLDEKEIEVANQNYQIVDKLDISNISNEDCTKLLWLIKKCPLMVDANRSTYEAIKLCKDRKFILLGENMYEEMLENRLVFQKFSDLKYHTDVMNEISEKFKCLLPEGKVSLQHLIQCNEKFNHVVTTNDLIMMLNDPYKIKEEKEKLSSLYSARRLTKIIVDLKFLESVSKDTAILISKFTDNENIMRLIKKHNPIYVDGHLKPVRDKGYVYVSREMFSQTEFLTLCEQDTEKKNFHHLRIWNGLLEWVKSINNISILENHLIEIYSTEESELWETTTWNNIHLITADPGLGKSCLMKNLKNNFSSKVLTLLFSPQDMKKICKHLQTENVSIQDLIFDLKFKSYSEFDICILQLLLKNNQVMFFWDALDEIAEDVNCDGNINTIANVIKNFSDKGIVQWLTCRRHIKSTLEAKFCVCARKLLPLTEEQQFLLIKERIRPICPVYKDLNDVIVKIQNNVAFNKCENMLNIPLHIYMLTELYIKDNQKLSDLLNEMLAVTDIYQYFVEEKFNFYYKDKVKVDAMQHNQLKQTQNNHIKQYQKAAMKAILDGEFLEQLNIDCDDFLNDIKQEGDCFGFITEVTNDTLKPVFSHISFAEYFVASYFFKRKRASMAHILFREKYSNVRLFFDMLLAKDCPPQS